MSTALHQVYYCRICGNVVQVVCAATGELVCCSRNMDLLVEHDGAADDAHRLIRRAVTGGLEVRLPDHHPRAAAHYIHWIEAILPGRTVRQLFEPGDRPVAVFAVDPDAVLAVRAYCTEHGLWRA